MSWHNWAGNVSASPVRVRMPRSAAEVADEVVKAGGDGLTIRMAGTGHSFTPTVCTDGVLLRPDGLTAIRSIDADTGLVTVEAGCPLRTLNDELFAHGLSLTNMGDIQVQTVAGATQTGTHGTGKTSGGMGAQIAGLEIVLADGSIVTCSAEAGPAEAAASRLVRRRQGRARRARAGDRRDAARRAACSCCTRSSSRCAGPR